MANTVLERQFAVRDRVATGPIVEETMTIGGVGRATGFLFLLLFGAAIFGWSAVDSGGVSPAVPGWLLPAVIGALVVAIATVFRPTWAPWSAPVYAVIEGALLGAISHVYDALFDGIVVQAVLATGVTFAVMLTLYVTRTIRVTARLRSIIVGATVAIFAFYMISILLSMFGASVPLVWDSGALGIGFSLVVIAVAAFNLMLDFDLIERGSAAGMPEHMNWYAAFGLVVTIVWLYLEILRLLAKLQRD
jgi:uncharacterized YccA/Bax inhibitor family protein